MGYFSNMTEAEMWQVDNCNKCAHWNAKCAMFIRRTKQGAFEARQLAKYNEPIGTSS